MPTASPPPVLDRPPESMRPDRREVMNRVGVRTLIEIDRGVAFECLVGSQNLARNLTTGPVTFHPGAALPYHTHPFGEAITVLQGRALVEVEGRGYELGPLDNIVIPRGIPHAAANLSDRTEAVLHIAMASHTPTRTLVEARFTRRMMPAESSGKPGAERVNRHATAPRFAAGPGTEFIDFFNIDLLPDIEMSGGYGLFHPGGRLPAHVHDFDESISIIDGTASCIVEGRRYALSDCGTALVPRGRVHYFINDSQATMAMIWVYAGPRPERIIVAESCATLEGSPWK